MTEITERIFAELSEIKRLYPYLRLGQIIVNSVPTPDSSDARLFYAEDEQLLKMLQEFKARIERESQK